LHALPIFHVHGLFIALHCALLGGTTTIFARRFDVAEILEWWRGFLLGFGWVGFSSLRVCWFNELR